MGQKKLSLLYSEVSSFQRNACKSGIIIYTWGGKSVLFREVSSVQGFYCRGVHCIKVECYVTLLCFQGKGNYACNQRGSSTSAFEVTPASVSVVSGYLVCVCMYVCMCVCACMYHRHKYVWAEYSVVRCIEVTGFCTNKDWYVETKPSSLGV